jgi:hypothetical protein
LKSKEKTKIRKSVRRKNKNLYQDIANAESSLTKDIYNDPNIYRSDSDERGEGEKVVDKMDDEYR